MQKVLFHPHIHMGGAVTTKCQPSSLNLNLEEKISLVSKMKKSLVAHTLILRVEWITERKERKRGEREEEEEEERGSCGYEGGCEGE